MVESHRGVSDTESRCSSQQRNTVCNCLERSHTRGLEIAFGVTFETPVPYKLPIETVNMVFIIGNICHTCHSIIIQELTKQQNISKSYLTPMDCMAKTPVTKT